MVGAVEVLGAAPLAGVDGAAGVVVAGAGGAGGAVALAGVPPGERVLFDVHLGQRFHNGGLRWGVESPSGYSSLPLWRVLHLYWLANHERTSWDNQAKQVTAEQVKAVRDGNK